MNKFFATFFCFTLIITFSGKVHAGAAAGGSTEWTQLANFARLVFAGAQEATTAVNTVINTAKTTIGNPFLAAMITGAQQEAARQMNNWAKGNFQGNTSVISNPEAYVRNLGLEAVRGGLINVSGTTGTALGDNVLGAVINNIRGQNGDLTAQLTKIAVSDVPTMLKENTCIDANLDQLVASEGLTPGSAEFTLRKNTLFNSLCVGDPRTDPALAQRLTNFTYANTAASQATALDSILLISSGDNPYVKATKSASEANKTIEAKEAAAKADLAAGGGNASKQVCVRYGQAATPSAANDYTPGAPPCLEYRTTTAGGQVNVSLSTSLTAGIDRLTNLGPDGFASLLGGYFMNAVMNRAVEVVTNPNDTGGTGFSSNNSYFGVTPSSGVAANVTNTAVTTVTNRIYTQNLVGDPDTKTALTTPIFRQLNAYSASLDELERTNNDYSTQAEGVQARINTVTQCFDSLVGFDASYYMSNSYVIAGYDRLKTLQDTLDTFNASIDADTTAVSTARSLISTTSASITASNSSAQINDIFTAYQNQLDTQNLPSITAAAERTATYERLRTALNGPAGSTTDVLTDLQGQCNYLTQQRGSSTTSGGQ